MSKMSDVHVEISQLITEQYSDQEISEKLRIPTGWVECVREEMEEEILGLVSLDPY